MLAYTMTPSKCRPPELYARYTVITGLNLRWEDLGERPSPEEISLITELINVKTEYDALKNRVQNAKR